MMETRKKGKQPVRTDRPDRIADGAAFVRTEIVHDDDVAGLQGWGEHLLDVGAEALAVDGTIEHARRSDAITSQRRDEGQCAPMAMRNLVTQTLATQRPAAQRGHVGLSPGFIDEHEPARIDGTLIALPTHPPTGDIRPILLACEYAFF